MALPVLPALPSPSSPLTIGVLALQGAFLEHVHHLRRISGPAHPIHPILVRSSLDLVQCSALIIPGGESTAIHLLLSNQLDPAPIHPNLEKHSLIDWLKSFVGSSDRAVLGTCAGLIMLSDQVYSITDTCKRKNLGAEGGCSPPSHLDHNRDRSPSWKREKLGVGGLPVRTIRNQYGNQLHSFEQVVCMPELANPEVPFPAVFIRAPMIHTILKPPPTDSEEDQVRVLAQLPDPLLHAGQSASGANPESVHQEWLGPDHQVVGLSYRNILATSFHPELTPDLRIHKHWVEKFVLRKKAS